MIIHLRIIGCLMIVLALVHLAFPRYFNWGEELKPLRLINRQMMLIHTLFVAIVVLLMGILCISSSGELITTNIGRKVCLGMGIFWVVRLYVQFFGYSKELWSGKRLETFIHIVFSILWGYFSLVFTFIYFSK